MRLPAPSTYTRDHPLSIDPPPRSLTARGFRGVYPPNPAARRPLPLLARARTTLGRLDHSTAVPAHTIQSDVLDLLRARGLVSDTRIAGYVEASSRATGYCRSPDTFEI